MLDARCPDLDLSPRSQRDDPSSTAASTEYMVTDWGICGCICESQDGEKPQRATVLCCWHCTEPPETRFGGPECHVTSLTVQRVRGSRMRRVAECSFSPFGAALWLPGCLFTVPSSATRATLLRIVSAPLTGLLVSLRLLASSTLTLTLTSTSLRHAVASRLSALAESDLDAASA
ncbi:hypothetical protein LZ30DRAFT_48791 [Colletotrichum cereale]|nr:hypothetical protein LZ30DRAFT_48791 [Colletotrichum cereale]